jgi:hypothetical protein
MTLAE